MRRKNDTLTRARQALSQVDAELDLGQTRSAALTRAGSGPGAHPEADDATGSDDTTGSDDAAGSGVEILPHGQRPALPRSRAGAWALVATVALLGGAGLGAAVVWPTPSETVPGAPSPASPTPGPSLSTAAPETRPTDSPRECASIPPIPDSRPTQRSAGQPSSAPQPGRECGIEPSPAPSDGPTAGPDDLDP